MNELHNNTTGSTRKLQFYLFKALIVLIVVGSLISIVPLFDTPSSYRNASILINLVVISIFSLLALNLTIKYPFFLLTPLPVTFGFIVLVFGIGPLIHFFGPETALAEYHLTWLMVAKDVFHVQVANVTGLTFVTLGLLLGIRVRPLRSRARFAGLNSLSNKQIKIGAISFLFLALSLRGTFWFLGINLLDLLPGFLGPISKVGWIAILLSSFLSGRKITIAWVLMLISLFVEIVNGALTLDRFDILMPLILANVGLYLGGGKIKTLIIGILFVAVLYIIIRPIVDVGRNKVWSSRSMTASQFWVTASDGEIDFKQVTKGHDEAGWWQRLNYTPIQNFLMDKYDDGQPGETYLNAYWLFIPRFIAPNKPILDVGRQVTIEVFGHENSSTGPTIFGESYWNGGWPLLFISGIMYGVIIWLVSVTCLNLFSQSSIFAWPIGIYGMLMGNLVSNFFTVGVIGGTVVFFALVGLYKLYSKRITRKRKFVGVSRL